MHLTGDPGDQQSSELGLRTSMYELLVQLGGQRLDPLNQIAGKFGQLRIPLQQLQQLCRVLGCDFLPLLVRNGKRLPVLCVSLGVHGVTRSLTRLRKQDERRSVGCLETERQIEQYKWINVELRKAEDVDSDPDNDDGCLRAEKKGCSKKASKGFRLKRERIVSKRRCKM
jgi:hypothetical protein